MCDKGDSEVSMTVKWKSWQYKMKTLVITFLIKIAVIQRTSANEYSCHYSGLKIQEFDVIQVLFKSSSIFQRFDWYNSHSQGEDVEWKI